MEEQTLLDTMESLKADLESKQEQINSLYELLAAKENKNRKRRVKEYNKSSLKETDVFVKSYPNEVIPLFDLKEQKKITNADLGRVWALSQFLEQDTSLITNPQNGNPMTVANMCKFIKEPRQHFDSDLAKLINLNIIVKKKDHNNKDIYFINNKYAFNGFSRANVTYQINNIFINNGSVEGTVNVG